TSPWSKAMSRTLGFRIMAKSSAVKRWNGRQRVARALAASPGSTSRIWPAGWAWRWEPERPGKCGHRQKGHGPLDRPRIGYRNGSCRGGDHGAGIAARRAGFTLHRHRHDAVDRDGARKQDEGDLSRSGDRHAHHSVKA